MKMFEIFKRKSSDQIAGTTYRRSFSAEGIVLSDKYADCPKGALESTILENLAVGGFLAQIEDDGRLTDVASQRVISWNDIYDILDGEDSDTFRNLLSLPNDADHVPDLLSIDSLRDRSFGIVIQAWRRPGSGHPSEVEICGGIISEDGKIAILPRAKWELLDQVSLFEKRPTNDRDESGNRRHWGSIRRTAISAGARLDNFLLNTVVITPEKLKIDLRKNDTGGSKVVEIRPTFDGAPEDWLTAFDNHNSVLGLYNITTPGGIIKIEIASNVRTVLESIKRMPGRRVAGARAESFIINPYAALGEAANETIDEQEFMESREKAGLLFQTFCADIERDQFGYPVSVSLKIDSQRTTGFVDSEIRPFKDDGNLKSFIEAVQKNSDRGLQLCAWQGYEFELMGNTEREVEILNEALEARTKPRMLVSYASIFNLSAYSARIEYIGKNVEFYIPCIAKKDEGIGWFPDNVLPVISWIPEGETEPVGVPMTPALKTQFLEKIKEAEQQGATSFTLTGFDKPIPVDEAKSIINEIEKAEAHINDGSFNTNNPPKKKEPKTDKHLIIKANISIVDYEESRQDILRIENHAPPLPSGLKSSVVLKDHQVQGFAWMHNLFRKAPNHCGGAVLADDMGLGKTLQILTLLASVFEQNPSLPPALIVAPVSLLENWEEEVGKFLNDGALKLLTAYGTFLSKLRVPKENIDEQLRAEGIVQFLKPGWRGQANVILTTYETLRDLEFAFGAEKWSVMVCDEAQRIKNPNAMVTRAAKKQNVIFKIACTGTPVENTLTDLWCLFDYVQPGLLGAHNDFVQRYRRPIEAQTEEEKQRVLELRARISPQILRRTKAEVAKDLPAKTEVQCRIPLSKQQRLLYARVVEQFKYHDDDAGGLSPFKNHLGLLQYLRVICTDPREVGMNVFQPEPLAEYRVRAPKMNWLIDTLQGIRRKEEKVIIFCEFREMQRMLRHYVEVVFGFAPDIINGDTAASGKSHNSRQKRIAAFQERAGFGVIILSPVAVGFGVNIQAANHVIHYTRHWNPAKEDQATDRAYRIGQTKPVFVYCPFVFADDFTTFDVKLDRLLTAKRELAKDMLNGAGDVTPGDFAIEEIMPGS